MVAERVQPWVGRYIGTPFLDGGRTLSGWDCWGLVAHVLPTHYGKVVPAFSLQYNALEGASIAQLIDTSRPLVPTLRVEVPEPGDIVLLTFLGHTCHVAVYVGEGLVLHALPKVGTVLDRLESVRLSRRLEGFYRVL